MDTKECNKSKSVLLISYIAFFFVIVVFYVISRCGYLWMDDYSMGYGENYSFVDVLKHTKWFYFHLGGRYLSVAAQYMFDGLFGNKIWYDIVNMVFFSFFIIVCGKLVNTSRAVGIGHTLLFVLLFWLLCPVPRETLFWIAGSTTYLWAHSLTFLFLLVFIKCKNKDYSWLGKLGLFFLSFFSPTEFIAGVSICGAFVVYYLCHVKEFKGNAIPLVVGFVIGTLVLMLAPGNFARMNSEEAGFSLLDNLSGFMSHPLKEVINYRVLWLLVMALLLGLNMDKESTIKWSRENIVMLLALGWSVIAFSVVFRPSDRALFFTETLSLVLFVSFLLYIRKRPCISKYKNLPIFHKLNQHVNIGRFFMLLLMVLFVVDAMAAFSEVKRQHENNERILNSIKASNGVTSVEMPVSIHRMAYPPRFPSYAWHGIANDLKLDSVHLYPYYCNNDHYQKSAFGNNVYVDYDGLISAEVDGMTLSNYGIVFVRVPNLEMGPAKRVSVSIDYVRPQRWYRSLLHKGKSLNDERIVLVERENPDENYLGYDYYFVWMKKENIRGLKSIDVELR